ncbi:RhoGEF domain-containing protein [Aphelenchoides avenae]|nr:RhoGEF domain-containing protein [Aphelenchus avenae]
MGGIVRQKYRNSLILITKDAGSTTAKSALAASTAETPVLTLEWIEACWNLRDDTDFLPTDQATMEKYKVQCFQGLRIFFLAFPEGSHLDEMIEKTYELNGTLAKTYEEATHVICDIDFRAKQAAWNDMAPGFPHPKIAHVTSEWFWQSVHKNQCLSEDLYPAIGNQEYRPLQPKLNLRKRNAVSPVADEVRKGRRNNSSKASVDNCANSSLPKHLVSSNALDELALPQKNDKRFQVCMEMLETEENYRRMLKLIKSVYRDPLEECLKGDKPDQILSRGEIQRIFDKVGPLIPVHENILEKLRCTIKNWNSQQLVGLIWAHGANDMIKVYSPYVNSYDDALKTLEECEESRPKFHSFLKAGEANPSCQKNSLKDMLIMPVQRIPSVLLLLRELEKRTEEHHPDFHAITHGIQMVENVLKKTNESRRQTETFKQFMLVCNDIENFPQQPRVYISQADFTLLEVDADGPLSRNKNCTITFLLFNDVVVIAKDRNAGMNTSGTLTRQRSLRRIGLPAFGSGKQKKKYKHIETLRFNSVRESFFIRDQGMHLQAQAYDTTVDAAIDFFQAVFRRVASTSFRREVVLEEITVQTMTETNILTVEDRSIIGRTLKSTEQLSPSGTIRRPARPRALQRLFLQPHEVRFKDDSPEHQ